MAIRVIICGFVLLAALVPVAVAEPNLDAVTGIIEHAAPTAAPYVEIAKARADPIATWATQRQSSLATPVESYVIDAPPTLRIGWDESSPVAGHSTRSNSDASSANDASSASGDGILRFTGYLPLPVTGITGALPRISGDMLALPLFTMQDGAAAPLPPAPANDAPAPAHVESSGAALAVSPVSPVIVAAAAAATAAAPGLAMPLWERLRRFGFLAVLYTRIAKERLLDHAGRDRLLSELRAAPGLSVVDLCARAQTPRNTATYHLRRLEKEGLVLSEARGRVRLWFPVGGALGRAQAPAIAALRHDTTRAIAEGIGASPGIDQSTLCAQLRLPPSLAHWHADRLVDAGLVRKERDGRRVRYYPGEAFALVARSA